VTLPVQGATMVMVLLQRLLVVASPSTTTTSGATCLQILLEGRIASAIRSALKQVIQLIFADIVSMKILFPIIELLLWRDLQMGLIQIGN
jgi:hypothetical protein